MNKNFIIKYLHKPTDFNKYLLNINKQLINFYKSSTLFKFLLFKNKYMILSLIVLGLITFLFNKNLNYFNDFTSNLTNSNLFSIKSITLFLISFYLIYIKFYIFFRIISLIKGIKFFYKEIKLNLIEDIKIICLYFFILNLFLISISILFVLNLTQNIFHIEKELGLLVDFSTSIISLIFLLFYFNRIINKKFIINQNQINPLEVLLIIFTPITLLIFYSDKIINLLAESNLFKFSSIHCDSKGDSNFITNKENNKLLPSGVLE